MLEVIAIFGLVAMVTTTLIGVVDRFIVGAGLPWPEEVARFLLVWTSLLAAAIAAKKSQHFRLAFMVDRLGPRWATLIDGVCLGALAVVVWQGVRLAQIFHLQTSPALGLPMSVVYAAVPVSGSLMAVYILRDVIQRWRERKGGQMT